MRQVSSFLTWVVIAILVVSWLPILAFVWLFDRDPYKYRTGKIFRKLGLLISRVNPNWKIDKSGHENIDDRTPYVIVSNHLSLADIPVISNLPWEMKWVAKKELFHLPVVGWMLRMAGDISVDRQAANKRVGVFKKSTKYLNNNISVIFFPEGTRSKTGTLKRFAPGAFDLAIRNGVPILPIAIDGTQGCLPKKDWLFKPDVYVKIKVLEPIQTKGLKPKEAIKLMNQTKKQIASQIAAWRGVKITRVDPTHLPRKADDV